MTVKGMIPDLPMLYSGSVALSFRIRRNLMPKIPTPLAPIPRHAETRLCAALADTRIVALLGPRQSGKTTLERKIELLAG